MVTKRQHKQKYDTFTIVKRKERTWYSRRIEGYLKSYPTGSADRIILLENVINKEHKLYIKHATSAAVDAPKEKKKKRELWEEIYSYATKDAT